MYIALMRFAPAMLLLVTAPLAAAQSPSRDWRPEDRTVIGDFSRITAIATSMERVYVTSPTALVIRHPQFQTWSGPFEPPRRDALAGVFAALVDPLDQSLWLARTDGWLHYQPELQLWDEGRVPDGVVSIAFDEADPVGGLYLRTRAGWYVLQRGAIVPTPGRPPTRMIRPTTVSEVIRQVPTLQTNAAHLMDSRMRPVRFTAAARAFDNQGWFLGTAGIGLLYLQDASAIPERIPFGLPANFVGAVMSWPGGVWAATNHTAETDAAFTFAESGLREFRTVHGLPATGTPFDRVIELAGQDKSLWAATDFGLARVDPVEGRIDLLDELRGLPHSQVLDVAARQGRIVVGTRRGLARLDDSLRVIRIAPQFVEPAYAVFPTGDSVWVGTPRGVFLAVPGEDDLLQPPGMGAASLQAPVYGFATVGDTLVALTRDQLMWRDPRTRAWNLGPNLSGLLGRLRRFAADGPGFWVAGERGVGFARLGGSPALPLREGDLPAPANDLAVDREHLWVGTAEGLVRFRLDAIRP